MRKFGLIGYPLGHSFSKKYFNEKFLREGISDARYENYPLKDISLLKNLLEDETDLCGLNVTIPYKSDILKFLDIIDPEVAEIGAANVLKISRVDKQIKLYGYNSDITGISDSLDQYIRERDCNAIVLGTGGSSKAVCHVLRKAGVNITLVSRISKPGIISYSDIDARLIDNTDLIINTTPLGMFPDNESRPDINYSLLNKNIILFDLVYNPEMTSFLKMGAAKGCTVISGLKMLHSQAEKSWTIWTDKDF